MVADFAKKVKGFSNKIYWREILACLLLFIGIYFLRKQRNEVRSIIPYLNSADKGWLLVALAITALFILLQSAMYVNSFAAVHTRLKWKYAIELFLKRNLLGVFLPGGGVSALAYTPINIKKSISDKIKIHQASGIFAFAGMLSTFIVGLPVLFINSGPEQRSRSIIGLLLIAGLILLIIALFKTLKEKGRLFIYLDKKFPRLARRIHELTDASVNKNQFALSIIDSVGVELCGIIHLYISMLAIGAHPSIQAAGIAYIISLLLMVASPFLKGLGAVELSIVYILTQFGYPAGQALAIAIVYRFFEFWLPMLSGLVAFLLKGKYIFLRVFPAVSIFILGLVNILSVVTPPLMERLHFVRSYIPAEAIHATNILVLFIGLTLMVTAAFLIKGMRNAWWIAIIVSFISIPGHLLKALDYEEAIVATAVFVILLFTKKLYKLKNHPRYVSTGIAVAIIAFVAVLIYGFIGFYFLEKRHFGIDFTWKQSIIHSMQGFFLLNTSNLTPLTRFGREFLRSFHVLGLLAWLFLLYSLIRPYLNFNQSAGSSKEKAQMLLEEYGTSSVDYFKLSDEKLIFISDENEGFVSYCVAGGFAIVLEEPVCAPKNKIEILKEFDAFCHRTGLKTAYYRIDESSVGYFTQLKKKKLLIGQEALLDVTSFDLAGRSKKALRNSLNSLNKKGYTTALFNAPHNEQFISSLKLVSDDWLKTYNRKEMIFAQGSFDEEILKNQDLIVTKDGEGKPVAFLNIIPDFAPNECTYDLIRKKADAPGGCMDALIIELINYARENGLIYLNLGLVPLSGITQPESPAEQVMKFAYNRIKRFRQYKGLREFKEKYASEWLNKYLIYENDFDLLQLPAALNKVMQPINEKLQEA
ncbi:MAG: phosphatidylglycerol lysyltransferase domain-containing protein [Flavisolibacter sp.]